MNFHQHRARRLTHMEMTDMIFKYRNLAITAMVAAASLSATLAQTPTKSVASGHREILLQTTQSWNGKPYTHYPIGQPELTTIKLTIAPHTVLPWHTHPIPNVVYVLSGTLTLPHAIQAAP